MTTMNAATEQFGDFSKASVDAAMQLAQVSLSSIENLVALNLQAAKVSLDQTASNARALTGAKDAEALTGLRTHAAETGLEFASGYSKNLYNVATAAQAQYTSLVEERMGQFQKSMAETLDKAAKSAPAGADVFVTAMKSSLAASTAAMDQVSKASKQASAMAETAFKTAAETAEKVTKPVTKRK